MTEIEKIFYERLAIQEEYGGTDKPVNKIQPLVSVVTITYQHAPYIRQCLDSILMQETDFSYEIIVGEDGSTDGTREICIEYAERYPDKIRLFLRNRKLSQYTDSQGRIIRFNGHFSRAEARGKYIALCEGDDYWIDKNKMKSQIDILENNSDCILCSHAYYKEMNNEIKLSKDRFFKKDSKYIIKYSIDNMPFWMTQPVTCMFKNINITKDLLKYKYSRDNHLFYHLLKEGNGIFLNSPMAVYRITNKGVYTSLTDLEKIIIARKVFQELYYFNKNETYLAKNYISASFTLIKQYIKSFNLLCGFKIFIKDFKVYLKNYNIIINHIKNKINKYFKHI